MSTKSDRKFNRRLKLFKVVAWLPKKVFGVAFRLFNKIAVMADSAGTPFEYGEHAKGFCCIAHRMMLAFEEEEGALRQAWYENERVFRTWKHFNIAVPCQTKEGQRWTFSVVKPEHLLTAVEQLKAMSTPEEWEAIVSRTKLPETHERKFLK